MKIRCLAETVGIVAGLEVVEIEIDQRITLADGLQRLAVGSVDRLTTFPRTHTRIDLGKVSRGVVISMWAEIDTRIDASIQSLPDL
ncbi:MAG: hypothetical protein KFF68_11965, partial [Desulfosarcina sp.]|nr:hypothetical protein [Desulfosarcina sp.]